MYIHYLVYDIACYIKYYKYKEKNIDKIKKLNNLLLNKDYMYRDFLIKNILSFLSALEKPDKLFNSLSDMELTQNNKNKEYTYIESQVTDVFDIFLSIIDIMYENYENYENYEKYKKETKIDENIVATQLFPELTEYNELLTSIKKDIKNRKVIFS